MAANEGAKGGALAELLQEFPDATATVEVCGVPVELSNQDLRDIAAMGPDGWKDTWELYTWDGAAWRGTGFTFPTEAMAQSCGRTGDKFAAARGATSPLWEVRLVAKGQA